MAEVRRNLKEALRLILEENRRLSVPPAARAARCDPIAVEV